MSLKLIPPGKRRHGKRGTNLSYIIRGTLGGRRVEIDTETTRHKVARDRQRDVETAILTSGVDLQRGAISFATAADLYIGFRKPRRADERVIERMKVDPLGRMLLQDINGAVLAQAADRICAGMMDATKNRNVMAPAAAILHYAAKNDLCEYERIDKFKEKLPDPRAVDVAVAELLVNSATGPMKLLLTWLFTVGTRISETLGVQRENINREARTFKMKMVKPERWETVPLPDAVLRLLPEDLGTGPLFPWKNRERVRLELKPLRDKLGLTFTPHQGRHTFATEIVNSGETLDHLPHWKDPKSRARYGRPSVERQRQVMERAGVRWGRGKKPR